MKIIGIKPNIRQYLDDKNNPQKEINHNKSISSPNYNFMKPIHSYTNSNKNIGKLSLLNSLKEKDNKKITKLLENNNLINKKNTNFIFKNNNSLIKENDCNNFRKSKTTDKPIGSNINLLIGYQENQVNNNNKKIVIKQNVNKLRKINLSMSKLPKYDNALFKQAMKYYTIKSESKTIQIEELSTYLRPIRNILGFSNNHKKNSQNNTNSSINIHVDFNEINISNYNDKKYLTINKNNNNKDNNNIDKNNEISKRKYNTISHDDSISKNNRETTKDKDNIKDTTEKNKNSKDNNNINNKINLNTSLIKNCVFSNNNKIPYTHRNTKSSKIPFSIKIDKFSSSEKSVYTNENINNKKNFNIVNTKISDNETQISTNNNVNVLTQENKIQQSQSQTLYQFRPRKMHLPKTVINLSSMQFKNKILQNILNKRKQNKANKNIIL